MIIYLWYVEREKALMMKGTNIMGNSAKKKSMQKYIVLLPSIS